jgi:hypothetical protein
MRIARRRKKFWFAALLALGLILAVAARNAGQVLVIDEPQPSDVILVLAGETDLRPALALRLLEQKYGRRVVMDVPAAARVYEFTQIQLAQKYIQDLPQAASISVCPVQGLSTKEETRDAKKCLGQDERVLIVTSDFHTRRALSIFRHELPSKVFTIAAARDSTQFGTRWWTHREWAKTCLYEWLRLLWWKSIDRWR